MYRRTIPDWYGMSWTFGKIGWKEFEMTRGEGGPLSHRENFAFCYEIQNPSEILSLLRDRHIPWVTWTLIVRWDDWGQSHGQPQETTKKVKIRGHLGQVTSSKNTKNMHLWDFKGRRKRFAGCPWNVQGKAKSKLGLCPQITARFLWDCDKCYDIKYD
jgi:hypothetical protein